MAVLKVATGDFSSNVYRTDGEDSAGLTSQEITLSDTGNDATHSEIVIIIQNRCRVHGVYLFNAEDDEVVVQLLDIKSKSSNTYDNVTAASDPLAVPVIYSTIVPRDAAVTQTIGGENWGFTLSMDLYDSPSGIYHEFPKPGFLFEDGVGVHYKVGVDEGDANPEVFWVIFYTEVN